MLKKIGKIASALYVLPLVTLAISEPTPPGPGYIAPGSGPAVGSAVENVTKTIASLFLFGAVVYMVLAGWKYITAGGDTKKIDEAKNNFIYGLIGIAIGLLAYAIPGMIKTFVAGGGVL